MTGSEHPLETKIYNYVKQIFGDTMKVEGVSVSKLSGVLMLLL